MATEKQILGFTIPEHVPWRKETDLGTNEKVGKIIGLAEQNNEVDPKLLELFQKEMKVHYIYESNVASSVGTQSIEQIVALLFSRQTNEQPTEQGETETLNMEKALDKMKKMEQAMSIENLKTIHKEIMGGDGTTDGKLRSDLTGENEVLSHRPDGSIHHYPHHTFVKHMLNGVLDQHKIHMARIPDSIEERIPLLIKSAAWILTRFVTIHPFSDGNGRICRMLANHVLSKVIPFPVHAYRTGDIDRSHYINAIIECQDDNSDPLQMSALLVDSIYNGYQKLEEENEKWLATKIPVLIPIQTNDSNEAWSKIKDIHEEATAEDQRKINQLFEGPEPGDNTYKEEVLTNAKGNVHYIVRVFKTQQ